MPQHTLPRLPRRRVAVLYLLLQHDAIHARLEGSEDQASFSLELTQPVEDLDARRAREGAEQGGELSRQRGKQNKQQDKDEDT